MRLPVILVIILVSWSSSARDSFSMPQQTAPVKQYFIAIFARGPAWDNAKPANEQTGFKEHSENLQRLRSEKKIPIGGRFGDKGMVIVEVQNEDEAKSLFSGDVMVVKKTFTLELHRFRPFYKGAIE